MNRLAFDDETLLRDELAAAERVLRSGWWILGSEVEGFERDWASEVGATHAVGVANGMEALEVGMLAMGIGQGDEVITTPMTAFATVLAILRVGAQPVFADIDLETAMISTDSVKRCIGPATRAVLLVHLYGQSGPVEQLLAICRENGIDLIEDCAQAHLARFGDRAVGSFGTFAAWSFYPTKNLGAIGDAGAITTSSDELAARCKVLRNYGQERRYHHPHVGMNSRMDELQAAFLRVRIGFLQGWTQARRSIAYRYSRLISHPDVQLMPLPAQPVQHVHHLFVFRTTRRAELQEHLVQNGVESLSHYPVPAHLQEPTTRARKDPVGLASAELHADQCLSIPCNPYLTDSEVEYVAGAINKFSLSR